MASALAGAFSLPCLATAETWTNAAGHAFEARAEAWAGQKVVFRKANGEELRLPLLSLSAAEQKRVKALLDGPEVPPALQPAYHYAAAQMDRARLLFSEGSLAGADYASRREEIIRSFKYACARQSYARDSGEVRKLVERLRVR
jgi:hypothetical protein